MTDDYAVTFDLDRAASALAGAAVGHTLDFHPHVESTMPLAHHLALRPDIRSGAVVLADVQTAGRGRLQRRWEAHAGQALLVSIVLKHGHLPAMPGFIPILAGLAVLAAVRHIAPLESHRLSVGLKWPNDVLLGSTPHQARKLAGILVESSFRPAQGDLEYAVVGIGINVNQREADLPVVEPPALAPTSLAVALGHPVDRTELLIALCRAFSFQITRPAPVAVAEWRSHLWTLGQAVTVHQAGGPPLHGLAVDVAANGALIVAEKGSGRLHTIEAGDVSLREPDLPATHLQLAAPDRRSSPS